VCFKRRLYGKQWIRVAAKPELPGCPSLRNVMNDFLFLPFPYYSRRSLPGPFDESLHHLHLQDVLNPSGSAKLARLLKTIGASFGSASLFGAFLHDTRAATTSATLQWKPCFGLGRSIWCFSKITFTYHTAAGLKVACLEGALFCGVWR
jgi:hypothetical protein